jgi:hypothetical protein
MLKEEADRIYLQLKQKPSVYVEDIHCPMILRVMSDKKQGTHSAFCVEACISETQFYNWTRANPLFLICYALGKMYSRENWEAEGHTLKRRILEKGESSHEFEYWRMIGWTRFGVGKNARIRLGLNPESNPNEHYKQLLAQAAEGDFTAGEVKQLMEAINVGLNAHQVFELQKEVNELRAALATIQENSNVNNQIPA